MLPIEIEKKNIVLLMGFLLIATPSLAHKILSVIILANCCSS
jgi:hypothetical protein